MSQIAKIIVVASLRRLKYDVLSNVFVCSP